MDDFRHCLETRGLVRTEPEKDLVVKELNGAELDLGSARKSLAEGNSKWATIQRYYAVFHAAKAIVLSKGFREKSHGCLLTALQELFVKTDVLAEGEADLFEDIMRLRWSADYQLEYLDQESLEPFVRAAASLIGRAREVVDLK